MKKIICKICSFETDTYRGLTNHIVIKHTDMKTHEYYDKFIGKTYCFVCGNETQYKGLKIGYRRFCSNKCSNLFKSKDEKILQKISMSQKGVPRKKHSDETKELISRKSIEMWKNEKIREKILNKLRSVEVREKISKGVCEYGYHKYISFINGIRCESKLEEKFIQKCLVENIKIKRFDDNGKKSIKIGNNWSLPDFMLDNVIVDVKDFHIWFKREMFSGLKKYNNIVRWCNNNGYIFLFWFEKYGYKTIEEMSKIKNEEDLEYFVKNYDKDV